MKQENSSKTSTLASSKGVENSASGVVALGDALLRIENVDEVSGFFRDLCTPNEWKTISDRWLVAQLVAQNVPYRKINEMTGVSTATITRVGRALHEGTGYQRLMAKFGKIQ